MDSCCDPSEAYARWLQEQEFDGELQGHREIDQVPAKPASLSNSSNSSSSATAATAASRSLPHSARLNLVDLGLEQSDPTPDIRALFDHFNTLFFGRKLVAVECRWSARMTLCAGLCVYEPGGYVSVRLSAPLLKLRPRSDTINTLLHEMIHALLFVTADDRDHSAHGDVFLAHAARINAMANTNITVYHSFHSEVDAYRVLVWKCSGPCVTRPPFFGLVKRAMNRPPGPSDDWYDRHATECGGTFEKIAGPAPVDKQAQAKKQKLAAAVDANASAARGTVSIQQFFKPVGEARQRAAARGGSSDSSCDVIDCIEIADDEPAPPAAALGLVRKKDRQSQAAVSSSVGSARAGRSTSDASVIDLDVTAATLGAAAFRGPAKAPPAGGHGHRAAGSSRGRAEVAPDSDSEVICLDDDDDEGESGEGEERAAPLAAAAASSGAARAHAGILKGGKQVTLCVVDSGEEDDDAAVIVLEEEGQGLHNNSSSSSSCAGGAAASSAALPRTHTAAAPSRGAVRGVGAGGIIDADSGNESDSDSVDLDALASTYDRLTHCAARGGAGERAESAGPSGSGTGSSTPSAMARKRQLSEPQS